MRFRNAFAAVFSVLVVAAGCLVIVQHGRLTVIRFQGLHVPLWALMAAAMVWPGLTLARVMQRRSVGGR